MIRRGAHSSAGGAPLALRSSSARPRLTARQLIRWILILGVLAFTVLYVSRSVIGILGASAGVAYLLDPVVGRLQARGYSREAGIILVAAAIGLSVLLAGLVILPGFVRQFGELAGNVVAYSDTLSDRIGPLVARINGALGTAITVDVREIGRAIPGYVQEMSPDMRAKITTFVRGVASGGLRVVLTVLSVTLMPVFIFYLLRDWPRIVASADALVPGRHQGQVRRLATEIDARIGAFVRGQIFVAFILTCVYTVGLLISGIDLALSMGMLSGVLFLVPFLGPTLALVLSASLALLKFGLDWHLVVVLATYGGGQLLENNFLTPNLIGDRVGLHPMVVIVSVIVFGNLFGIWGLILALPLTATLAVLGGELLDVYRGSRAYTG